MYYVVSTSDKGYFIVTANDELEKQRYETNCHFQSTEEIECQEFIDNLNNQDDDSIYDRDYDTTH